MSYKIKKLEKLLLKAGVLHSRIYYGWDESWDKFGWCLFDHRTANSKYIGKNIDQATDYLNETE
jgi:hypothetical protein